jgi:low temperature requirement protein LtrA
MPPMSDDTTTSGSRRAASTLELFFDLVYVFAITQVVGLLHDGASVTALAQGALLLWLLWWTWSTYTWTTNWSGTDGSGIRLFILAAMGITLLMALSIPTAFGEGSQWFGITYFTVRVLGNALYLYASRHHPEQRSAFMTFFPGALLASVLVLIGGFLEPPWLTVLWIASAAIDVFSAANASRGTWTMDAHHFAERNGLFIIVALGETIVGVGLAAVGVERDLIHLVAIGVGFVIAASLWWAYFNRAAVILEEGLEAAPASEIGQIARDAYSFAHYPLVVGIVYYAVAAEEIVAHPDEPLDDFGRFALAFGVSIALLAISFSVYRVRRRIPTVRIGTAVVIMAVGFFAGSWSAVVFGAAVAAIIVASLIWTETHAWSERTDLAEDVEDRRP